MLPDSICNRHVVPRACLLSLGFCCFRKSGKVEEFESSLRLYAGSEALSERRSMDLDSAGDVLASAWAARAVRCRMSGFPASSSGILI